jgi:preprotein translocase subunit SecG
MSSSPLRRVLSVSLLLAGLALLSRPAEAVAVRIGPNDGSVMTSFELQGFLERVWSAFVHLWAADGSRIDPNGANGVH